MALYAVRVVTEHAERGSARSHALQILDQDVEFVRHRRPGCRESQVIFLDTNHLTVLRYPEHPCYRDFARVPGLRVENWVVPEGEQG